MTALSRSPSRPWLAARENNRPNWISLSWHTACFALLTGCFYVKPIPGIELNQPPLIIEPDEDPKVVEVVGDTVVFTILATDPEGDALEFEWPDLANVPTVIDVYERGQVTVCRTEVEDTTLLEDGIIRAFVFDGDRDNIVTVRFDVVLP